MCSKILKGNTNEESKNFVIFTKYHQGDKNRDEQDRQNTCKRNIKARPRNHCSRAKAWKRLRHIGLSSVACLAVPYFDYLINRTLFGKKVFAIKCVF